MRIKIYQIQSSEDESRVLYMDLNQTLGINDGIVDPSIYRKVYDGEVGCQTLEGVYARFNCGSYPEDYYGHSLFISDVVETENGCYFCGGTGFEKIEFDSSKTLDREMLRVLYMEPGEEPEPREIPDDYTEYEKLVGEFSCSYVQDCIIVHHKDDPAGHPSFVVSTNAQGEMVSVTEDQDGMLSLILQNAFAGGDSAVNQ